MFDTCHPEMTEQHIADAVSHDRPDVIGLSFLSTTTYPAAKRMARRLKCVAPSTPIIVGGPFATMNADRILEDCPDIDCVGKGEGEELHQITSNTSGSRSPWPDWSGGRTARPSSTPQHSPRPRRSRTRPHQSTDRFHRSPCRWMFRVLSLHARTVQTSGAVRTRIYAICASRRPVAQPVARRLGELRNLPIRATGRSTHRRSIF